MALELETVVSGYNLSKIKSNFDKIEASINNDLLRRNPEDGESNEMDSDIDMNGYKIANLQDGEAPQDAVTLGQAIQYEAGAYASSLSAKDSADRASEAAAAISTVSEVNSLLVMARSLNVLDSQIISTTDTDTILDNVAYLYDPAAQVTYIAPTLNGGGEKILSVVGDVLTTTGGAYQLSSQLEGVFTYTLEDAVNSNSLLVGDFITIIDRDMELFKVVLTSEVTPNTFDIIVSETSPTLSLELINKKNMLAWGVVEGGTVDCADAIEAWDSYRKSIIVNSPHTANWPAGKYLLSRGIDFSTVGLERSELIGGSGFEVVEIICDFNGYGSGTVDEYVFNIGDENSGSYHSSMAVRGFHFSKGANCLRAPVAIMAGAIAQSRISGITHGDWNNNVLRLVSPQNTRISDYSCFSGGVSFEYKDASTVTVTQSGTTLTSSGAIFSTADVGHTINIWGTGGSTVRRKCVIIGYTSTTEVTVSTDYTDGSARALHFGSPLVSISSGSTTLTADADCFSAESVGLTVWVKGGTLNSRFLREKIVAYISPTQVTLANGASATVTGQEFTVPAVDAYSSGVGGASDNTFELQIENHMGVGICLMDFDIANFIATKVHGEQTVTSTRYSIAPMWLQQVSGFYQGSFDAQYLGEQRIYATYQTGCFNFESLSTRTANDEQLLYVDSRASGFEGGIIQLDDLSISGASSTSQIEDLIYDANTNPAGYILSGKVSFNEYDKTRVYVGSSYVTADGNLQGVKEDDISTVVWDGTPPTSGAEKYQWGKFGNVVFFDFRLDYGGAGSSNSEVTITLPVGMPTPKDLSPQAEDELHSACSGFISTTKNAATAPALSKCRLVKVAGGTYKFKVTLNSGTVSAIFASVTGFYFT